MNFNMDFNVKTSKIINFFSQLEKKEIISQSNLAKSVLISLGMANAILKKAISKGYVKARLHHTNDIFITLLKKALLKNQGL